MGSTILTFFYEQSKIDKKISLSFLESNKVAEFEEMSEVIRTFQNARNVRLHSENSTDKFVMPVTKNNLKITLYLNKCI
ncbi:hypothetical protein GCM10025884_10380 [Leuconostoc gelidum subsp. gelidum]|nr:hypothetical protein GCM10025884_10380 [Leuconostoc gelidum subsp. gelidum]